MAPTICDDTMEAYGNRSINRMRRHCSVINYVGRRVNEDNEVASSDDRNRNRSVRDQLSERQIIAKRCRHENNVSSENDDSSNSIPSPMAFHNYAKRQRFSDIEDENSISSTSSELNEQTVSSSSSPSPSSNEDSDRENMIKFPIVRIPFAPYSPVSSTTDTFAFYHRLSKSPQHLSPFYRQDLMEIAMKTIILLQKNRSLHERLHQLKLETRAFVDSVMANPENAKLRQINNQSNDKLTDNPAFKISGIKN